MRVRQKSFPRLSCGNARLARHVRDPLARRVLWFSLLFPLVLWRVWLWMFSRWNPFNMRGRLMILWWCALTDILVGLLLSLVAKRV
jgi:hypothetical protein